MVFGLGSLRRPRFWMAGAALLSVYAVAGFWLAPKLLDSTLRDSVATRYGRKLQLGEIRVNPFSFELDVRNFHLPDADGGRLVSFDRLYVNLSLQSVLRWGLAFQAIELDAPQARVVRRPDGTLNLADLAGPPAAEPEPDSPLPRIWIERLAVNAGQAEVVDQARQAPLRLALIPISFSLREFSSRGDGNAYAFSAQSSLGEQLRWRGTFGLAPLASRGNFELAHVRAQTLADVALERAPFEVSGGELTLQGHYDVAARGKGMSARVAIERFALRALGLRTRGVAQDAVFIPELDVTDARLDAAAQSVTVGQVLLSGARVQLARDRDGQLDLLRWLPREASRVDASPAATSAPWNIAVPEIRLAAADVQLTDHGPMRAAQAHAGPLDIQVNGFASPARGPLEVQLTSHVNETGQLSAKGQVNLSPLSAQLDLDAADLPLSALQPYLDDHTSVIVRDGRARLQGQIKLAADGGVVLTGRAGVDALHTVDAAMQEDFIKWRSLDLLGLRVHTQPVSLVIDELVANEPYARMIVAPDHTLNLQEVLRARSAEPQPTAAATAPPLAAPAAAAPTPIEIRLVRVQDGSLNFADLSLKPSFATGLQQLRGTIAGLSADPGARADVKLDGRVGRYSPVSITGKLNYFAAAKHTDLHLRFKNMELTAFTPYSGKFAGYKIERGKLDLDLHYLIDRRRLAAEHKIVMKQLQLGAAVDSPDATSLPVKLAIALLKDRHGVIDLDLPVSGNLDDPHFKVGPLIWKVVLNLLSKAVSAPFALLGSLFGAGEEIAFIEFAPGDGSLTASSREKLRSLARALEERPTLNLDVPFLVAPQLDRNALLETRFRQKLEARATRELGAKTQAPAALVKLRSTPPRYRALLERMYRESFGKAAQIPPPPTAANAAAPPKPPVPRQYPFVDGPGHGALARRAQQPEATPSVTTPAIARVTPVPTHGLGHSALASTARAPQAPVLADGYAIGWLEAQLKTRIPVQEQELSTLAQARAQSVQSALLDGTGIDPSRVFVIEAPPLSAGAALRMQLALH